MRALLVPVLLLLAAVGPSAASADYEIYSIAVDGSDRRNLSQSPATSDGMPAISPDGARIAFVRSPADYREADVWLMGADGTGQRRIVRDGLESRPVWSPDSRLIAFTRAREVAGPVRFGERRWRYSVEVVDVESGATVRRFRDLRQPRWSPDGRWLTAVDAWFGGRLWLLDAAGRRRGLLATLAGGVEVTDHVWSADASTVAIEAQQVIRIAAEMRWTPDSGKGLYVVHLYGRLRKVVSGSAIEPAWSPSGMLAFTRWRVAPGPVPSPRDVWQVVPGDAPRLTSDRSVTLYNSAPAWSPDGSLLAFAGGEFGRQRIYVARADGGGARPVGPDEWRSSVVDAPAWMPDGRRLVYTCC
jgi:Tol biopolymer transport system component